MKKYNQKYKKMSLKEFREKKVKNSNVVNFFLKISKEISKL